jgi:hypothetical protein
MILLAVLLGQARHRLNERIVVQQFPDATANCASGEPQPGHACRPAWYSNMPSSPHVRQRNLAIAIPPGAAAAAKSA